MVLPSVLKAWFHEARDSVIDEAVHVLGKCGLVVAATDTLYGLLADPFRDECVLKVYRVKERPLDKPLPLLASSIERVADVTGVSGWIKKLLEYLWPGPVTVILKVEKPVFSRYVSPSSMIGFRVPAAPLIRRIAEKNNGFVTGTSANLSGLEPPRKMFDAYKQLGRKVDLYIDQGPAPIGGPSAVIQIAGSGFKVIRRGVISIKTIEKYWRLAMRE